MTGPDRKHWLEYAIALFVVATAIFTGIAAYYTREQWKTANQALIVSERAFVYFGKFTAIIANDPDAKIGPFLAMGVALTNSGNTRTRDLLFTVKCTTSPGKLVEPWGLLHQETVEHLPQVIGPKSDVQTFCGWKKAEVSDMAAGKLVGYVLGEVIYHDVFEPTVKHVTQVAQEITITHYVDDPFTISSQLNPKGAHNCADEDCPK
jgi:hypothetical protein